MTHILVAKLRAETCPRTEIILAHIYSLKCDVAENSLARTLEVELSETICKVYYFSNKMVYYFYYFSNKMVGTKLSIDKQKNTDYRKSYKSTKRCATCTDFNDSTYSNTYTIQHTSTLNNSY